MIFKGISLKIDVRGDVVVDQRIKERYLDLQETIRKDSGYQALVREYEILSRQLSGQMEAMTRDQQDAVTDYCGLLIELQWKVLEYALGLKT